MAHMAQLLIFYFGVFAQLISLATAADCSQQRKEGDPSGVQIADALTKNNALSNICSGNFSPQSETDNTWNYWYINYIVHRDDGTQALQNCNDAFQNIIDQCISGGNYWGGEWSLNGFKYSISNSIYDQTPNNPLAPGDAGGPLPTPSSSEAAAPPAGATVVTETIDGNAVPVTFVPTTFPDYATLTSTTTVTTTTSDDSGNVVVIPWIVGPGGIAFVPIGGVPLPPGITPPPVAPTDPNSPTDPDNNPTTDDQPSSSSSSSSACKKSLTFAAAAGTPREGFQIPIWVRTGRTPTSSSSSSFKKPNVQTVTADCNVCTLIEGSLHPVCTPIPECTLTPSTSTSADPPAQTSYPACAGWTLGALVAGASVGVGCLVRIGASIIARIASMLIMCVKGPMACHVVDSSETHCLCYDVEKMRDHLSTYITIQPEDATKLFDYAMPFFFDTA
ncbi:hypothetical protein PMIN04_001451 [Paraphaeosphaeria minitans]